jgi:hypothetical protein
MDGLAKTTEQFKDTYSKIKDDATAHNFVKVYGTHWIENAVFGAQYDKVVYIGVDRDFSTAESFKRKIKNQGADVLGVSHSTKKTDEKLKKA